MLCVYEEWDKTKDWQLDLHKAGQWSGLAETAISVKMDLLCVKILEGAQEWME